MFTGLVEEVGTISEVHPRGNEISIVVSCHLINEGVNQGDSINIDGVCQTVVAISKEGLRFDTVAETLKKTTFSGFKRGTRVNLERALRADSRLGGHFVLGHVDTTGKVGSVVKLTGSHELIINFDSKYDKYVIPVGSICINGVSLTVAEKGKGWLKVAIIPHTWVNTSLAELKVNSEVNLEYDILGKYILNYIEGTGYSGISVDKLKDFGFA
jgi:riboflavin synthase